MLCHCEPPFLRSLNVKRDNAMASHSASGMPCFGTHCIIMGRFGGSGPRIPADWKQRPVESQNDQWRLKMPSSNPAIQLAGLPNISKGAQPVRFRGVRKLPAPPWCFRRPFGTTESGANCRFCSACSCPSAQPQVKNGLRKFEATHPTGTARNPLNLDTRTNNCFPSRKTRTLIPTGTIGPSHHRTLRCLRQACQRRCSNAAARRP